jgi:pimeloyl-ACP methyl ester carboxylesterase
VAAIAYRTTDVDGVKVFFREAGAADAPKLLLLHGFPTSSHMFRDLIPLLADRFHIIAPDLPGFGPSDRPKANTFEFLADTITASPRPWVSIASPSTCSTMAHRPAFGWPRAIPSGSRRSFPRTATPMSKG